MLRLIFSVIFSVFYLFGSAQINTSIVITDWVNKPDTQDFKKPLLFVDFWATWCIPCIHAMPQTELLKEEFGDDVLFLYVSDESFYKVKNFMERFDKNFYSGIDNSKTNQSKFNIRTIPYSVLLNNVGKVIWKGQPVDLDRSTLQNFVNRYKNKVGLDRRITFVRQVYKQDDWLSYYSGNDSLFYMEKDFVSDTYSVDEDEYYFSGDIKYIVSVAFDISLSRIIPDVEVDKKYIVKCKTNEYDSLKMILRNFLSDICEIEVVKQKKTVDAYIIEDGDNQFFLNVDYINYGKGNNSYLADDMNVMIDNATIKEMTDILSNFSGYRFIYRGTNKNRYDWSVHYKFIDLTLEQFKSELGFSITKEKAEVEFLHLTRKIH